MTTTMIASPASPRREDIDQELTAFEKRLTHGYDQIRAAEALRNYREVDAVQHLMQPRAVMLEQVMRIDLRDKNSWIEAKVTLQEYAHTVVSVTYHAASWLAHERRDVTEEDCPSIWRYAQHYAATF